MNLSVIDYKESYSLQDKVFTVLKNHTGDFYLTGGTALSRFYLNHRYSDDLDFFVNHSSTFLADVRNIIKLLDNHFTIDKPASLEASEYVKIWLIEKIRTKIEFVNDVSKYWGKSYRTKKVLVDNPANILANKLTALVSRDEPKDVFDIVTIAENWSFNWREVYEHAVEKQLINEPDIAIRLSTFPVEQLLNNLWLKESIDLSLFKEKLETIIDDFLLASDNSLGKGKTPIVEAIPAEEKW